mgnify:CR=1 FL=1
MYIDNVATVQSLEENAPRTVRDARFIDGRCHVIDMVTWHNTSGYEDLEVTVTVEFDGGHQRRRYVAHGTEGGYVVTRADKYVGEALTSAGVLAMIVKDSVLSQIVGAS